MKELLVVARYNENLDWLKEVKQNHIVYNKGINNLPDWVNQITIPNIGREEYVYLKYIHDNYDSLADRIIFCQGDAIYHSPDFLELLKISNLFLSIQPLSFGYCDSIPQYKNLSSSVHINKNRIHVDLFDRKLFRYCRIGGGKNPIDNGWLYNFLSKFLSTKDVRLGMHNILGLKPRNFEDMELTPMCYAGIFSVIKDRILQYPKDYYSKLLCINEIIFKSSKELTFDECFSESSLTYDDNHVITFGYIMELMWLELYGYEPPKQLFEKVKTIRRNMYL